MESPNSGSLLFLAFWEMPAMDSPSTYRTEHTLVRDHLPLPQHVLRLSSWCFINREETTFPFGPKSFPNLPILPQTSTSISGLTLEFSMTLSRQLK